MYVVKNIHILSLILYETEIKNNYLNLMPTTFNKIVIYLTIPMVFRRLKSNVVLIVVVKTARFFFLNMERLSSIVLASNDAHRS